MHKKTNYKLAVLYLECQRDKYPNAFEALLSYLHKLINCDSHIVKIDNNIDKDYFERLDSSKVIINGDNKCREFSGWQQGVNYLNEENNKYDAVLFVNDSFLVYGSLFADAVLRPETVEQCVAGNALIGIVDKPKKIMEIDGYNITQWVRTNCFILSEPVFSNLPPLCAVDNTSINRFIPLKPTESYFRSDAPVNEYFKNHVIDWLSSGWHSKFNLYENWDLFRYKTCAILNEKLFTARIVAKGFDVVCARENI